MRSVLFHAGVAARTGLNITDVACLALLDKEGPLTPGALAAQVGLTKGGAITAVVDRLDKAGFARRRRSSQDRRQVPVELVREGPYRDLEPLLSGVNAAYTAVTEHYSDAELATVLDFATRVNQMLHDQTAAMRARS
ncbi:MarR family transcriptional regulator [Nonomuraea turkmeniaca]|uniref:MarR family transcriptional regulator n=2 Tax=Nonomuraea turkmeniaca TaxID=103838 RepID=A0A5S4FRT3_9ACTN|nr:MarR family transcriptional regulator [Nonomuraea turkmeniaca]